MPIATEGAVVITPIGGVPLPVLPRAEWWERALTARRNRGTHHRPADRDRPGARSGPVRSALSWLCLAWVVLVSASSHDLRLAVQAFLVVVGVLLLWFLLARTRTTSWRLATAVFAAAVLWAAAVALAQGGRDLRISEPALLAAPLAILPGLMPGRSRRFSVTDWLVVGAALGLGYAAVAQVCARVAQRPDDAGERALVYAAAGLLTGLAVAAWRHGARRHHEGHATAGRQALVWQALAVLAPGVGAWLVLGTDLPADGPARSLLSPAHAAGTDPVLIGTGLAVLGAVAVLLDTRRMRAADEPGTERLPQPFAPADAADRWTLAVTGPGNGGRQSALLHATTAAVWALCCLITYTVRDVAVVLGAHTRAAAEPHHTGIARGRAASVLTRVLRAEAFRPLDGAGHGRRHARVVSVLAVLLLLVAGAAVAAGTDTISAGWLATAVTDRPGDPDGTSLGTEILLWTTVLALVVVCCDGPGTAYAPAGHLRPLLDRGRGPATFVLGRTTLERLTHATVTEFLLDAAAGVLTLVPQPVARRLVGSAAGPQARAAVDEFTDEPAAYINRRRRELLRAGVGVPDRRWGVAPTWDPVTRRRWVDAKTLTPAPGARILSADGRTGVPVDGLHLAADGVATLEAIRIHPGSSGLLYEGQAPTAFADRLLAPFDDEMRRYATVIRDPRNPVARLRLVVGSARAGEVLGERARQVVGQDLDLEVVVDPVGG
jgi:hypothetical protein